MASPWVDIRVWEVTPSGEATHAYTIDGLRTQQAKATERRLRREWAIALEKDRMRSEIRDGYAGNYAAWGGNARWAARLARI